MLIVERRRERVTGPLEPFCHPGRSFGQYRGAPLPPHLIWEQDDQGHVCVDGV